MRPLGSLAGLGAAPKAGITDLVGWTPAPKTAAPLAAPVVIVVAPLGPAVPMPMTIPASVGVGDRRHCKADQGEDQKQGFHGPASSLIRAASEAGPWQP